MWTCVVKTVCPWLSVEVIRMFHVNVFFVSGLFVKNVSIKNFNCFLFFHVILIENAFTVIASTVWDCDLVTVWAFLFQCHFWLSNNSGHNYEMNFHLKMQCNYRGNVSKCPFFNLFWKQTFLVGSYEAI